MVITDNSASSSSSSSNANDEKKILIESAYQRAFVVHYVKQQMIGNMFSPGTSSKHPLNYFRLPSI